MAEKNEVKDEELEEVSGGWGETATVGRHYFTGHVGKYDAVPGTKYYAVKDIGSTWYSGTLIRSYEKDNWLWGTTRTHVFDIDSENGHGVGNYQKEISGDSFSLYTKCKRK